MEIVKGGRPVKVLTETDVTKLEALACVLTKSQVADYFGMTEKTLRAIEGRQPEVSTAYRKGKAMAIVDVASSLYEQAKNGNIQAAKFYLKTQAGWREDVPVELSQPDDDRTWKIQIMRAKEDGTIEPTDRVVEVARPIS
jgi:hypothetical protein